MKNASYALLVPFKVDALHLNADKSVLSAFADFSRLPYTHVDEEGQAYDVNPDTAYLSESVALPPFSESNLILKKGIHLHWALPDGLVNAPGATADLESEQRFPAVPNRWLVSRIEGGVKTAQWVVESDFLYPLDTPPPLPHVAVPMPAVVAKEGQETIQAAPFRYMGRAVPLAAWENEINQTSQNEYWSEFYQQPLTAVGYGEPTFASYFPNCYAVFGCYDDLTTVPLKDPTANYEYEVLGWYEKTPGYTKAPDYLHQRIEQFKQQPLTVHKQPLTESYRRKGRLLWKTLYNWNHSYPNSAKKVTPEAGKVAPAGYGSGLEAVYNATQRASINGFLTPAEVVQLDIATDLPSNAFSTFVDAVWTEIIGLGAATVQQLSAEVLLLKAAPSSPTAPYLKAYSTTALSDFLNPDKHLRLFQFSQLAILGNLTAKKIWQQLVDQQWIVPLPGEETSLAAVMPMQKRKPLGEAYRRYKKQLQTLLSGAKVAFITKSQLQQQLTIYFEGLPDVFLLPKKRITDRYGAENQAVLWTFLLNNNYLLPFTADYAYLPKTITKGYTKKYKLSTNIGKLLNDDIVNGKLLNPHGSFSVIRSELVNWRFSPTKGWKDVWKKLYANHYVLPSTVTLNDGVDATFATKFPFVGTATSFSLSQVIANHLQQADVLWEAQINTKQLIPVEGKVNTSVIGNKIAVPEAISAQIHQLIYTLSQSDIRTAFGQEYVNELWQELLAKSWISEIPDAATLATINPTTQWLWPLAAQFKPFQTELQRLLDPNLKMAEQIAQPVRGLMYGVSPTLFTSQFGLEVGRQIWDGLIDGNWITAENELQGMINNTQLRLDLAEDLKPYLQEITELLSPQIHRQAFLDRFGAEGTLIWEMLVLDGWVLVDPTTCTEAIMARGGAALQGPDFIQYAFKTQLQRYLHSQLSWHMGSTITRTKFNDALGLGDNTVWTSLDQKGWILPNANQGADLSAIIEPVANRIPLEDSQARHQDAINEFFYQSILQQAIPEQSLFFGKVTMDNSSVSIRKGSRTQIPKSASPNTAYAKNEVEIAVANSSTEALSAYLAAQLVKRADTVSKSKGMIEDVLEGVQFSRKLKNIKFDLAAKFQEQRHHKEFLAHKSGIIWTIQPFSNNNNADQPNSTTQVDLPTALAHELNALNTLHRNYEKAHQQIISLRQQLFMDWYKYLLSVYPPQNQDLYPDIDTAKYFIEEVDLSTIQKVIEHTGILKVVGDENNITGAVGHFIDLDHAAWDYGQLPVIKTINELESILLQDDPALRIFTQAHLVAQQVQKVLDLLNGFNESQLTKASPRHYTLGWVPAPRYWEAKEPVVLLTGDSIVQTDRHGEDGAHREDNLLDCFTVGLHEVLPIAREEVSTIMNWISIKVSAIEKAVVAESAAAKERIGFRTCSSQPWHPMMLEWEVNFTAMNDPTHGNKDYLGYEPHFIDNNYTLPEESPRYQPITDEVQPSSNKSYYRGYSLLSPSAISGFEQHLLNYLKNYGIDATQGDLDTQLAQAVKTMKLDKNVQDILKVVGQAYQTLPRTNALAQSLSGFNAALLQQRKTLQFKIADPLGFTHYQAFTNKVRKYVGNYNTAAPAPSNDFNPLRAGSLELRKMRLIDTFGQTLDLETTAFETTEQMQYSYNPHTVNLPPRISQPARLNLRWLSADYQDIEMNSHPATSPICGWLLLNKLDDSLMIYDNQGTLLGSINESGAWQRAPGDRGLSAPTAIANTHLQKMVTYIQSKGTTFQSHFIEACGNALENIHPEYFTEHQDLSLLMSRPVALVRAEVSLDIMGLPQTNHSWDSFRADIRRGLIHFPADSITEWLKTLDANITTADLRKALSMQMKIWKTYPFFRMDDLEDYIEQQGSALTLSGLLREIPKVPARQPFQVEEISDYIAQIRETYNYENVTFPVRLGDYRQLNDGLVAYWDGVIDEGDKIYMPQTTSDIQDASIEMGSAQTLTIDLSIKEPVRRYSMLIDPTGSLHATSGILPVKEIDIPADQYKDILRKLEVTFLAAPLLTPRDTLRIPIPSEPNYRWSWLQKVKGEWLETPTLKFADFSRGWAAVKSDDDQAQAQQLWEALFVVGWLSQLETDALVVPEQERRVASLPAPWTGMEEQVSDVLSLYQWNLAAPKLEGAFSGTQRLVEGYLKLKKIKPQ
ncbi:MAG: hypothetical protein AAGG75_16830 [Bacteroidota bacterium]